MKIIFLDIDGVLNTERNNNKNYGRPRPFDPEAISALNKIIKETDAKIVISSSWRYMYDTESMGELLFLEGLPKDIVIGENPKPSDNGYSFGFEDWDGTDGTASRGRECLMWIENHYQNGGEFIERYVAIEDLNDMTALPDESIYMTSPIQGLTMEMAEDIIEYLNKGKCSNNWNKLYRSKPIDASFLNE